MFRCCETPSSGLGGPMWFIQIWLYAYFSSLAPSPKISPKPITYGQVWMEGHYQDKIPMMNALMFSLEFLKRRDLNPYGLKKGILNLLGHSLKGNMAQENSVSSIH